jgi:hypothetical protein
MTHSINSLNKLLTQMTIFPVNFSHLQVFLRRERENNYKQDYEFLMITPILFGNVKLLNLNVEVNYVMLEFIDFATMKIGTIRVDVND